MRVELDGEDVTALATDVFTVEEVGLRRTAGIHLTHEEGVTLGADDLILADGSQVILADGTTLQLGGGDPDNFQRLVISHPDRTFRDAALELSPWLYWPLDDGAGLLEADDISGFGRRGTWSTVAGALIRRHSQAEQAGVPYGAAPRLEAGADPGVTGPPSTGLGEAVTVSVFVEIDTAAPGGARIVSSRPGATGMSLSRTWVAAGRQRITWYVNGDSVTAEIAAGGWVWLVATRSAARLELWVDGARVASGAATSPPGRVDAAAAAVDLGRNGTLDAEVDELAIWDRELTAAEIAGLAATVPTSAQRAAALVGGWRAFGGEVYGKRPTPDKSATIFDLPAVGGSMRIDRSDLLAAFATANNAPAGEIARQALELIRWKGTTYGCDLDTLIGRIVSRGGSAAGFLDRVKRAAEAIWWPDAFDDVHLDRLNATRHVDVVLTEELVAEWDPEDLMEHYRTRTVARGAGVSGGFTDEEFTGDGLTTSWKLEQQSRSVTALIVAGVHTPIGSGSDWQISPEGFVLSTSGAAPAVGVRIKIEYEIETPLVAIAEDTARIREHGEIVRTVEDNTIDTAEGVQELARVEQATHGQIGLEVTAVLHPRERPLFVGVGISPLVRMRRIDQRMVVQRLETKWVSAGRLVVQTVTLRSHDILSPFEYLRDQTGIELPSPAPQPQQPPTAVISTIGQRLPQPLGGAFGYTYNGAAWLEVDGYVEVTLNWALFAEVALSVAFMGQLHDDRPAGVGARTGRVRLRDITRDVTLGQEVTVSGSGPRPYRIEGVVGPAAGGISRLRLQRRIVDVQEIEVWGGELDVSTVEAT